MYGFSLGLEAHKTLCFPRAQLTSNIEAAVSTNLWKPSTNFKYFWCSFLLMCSSILASTKHSWKVLWKPNTVLQGKIVSCNWSCPTQGQCVMQCTSRELSPKVLKHENSNESYWAIMWCCLLYSTLYKRVITIKFSLWTKPVCEHSKLIRTIFQCLCVCCLFETHLQLIFF